MKHEILSLPDGSIFVYTLKAAAKAGQIDAVIQSIYEQTKDNRPLVCQLVGEDLVKKIENLCYTA